jgi:hypothetical protein
MATRVYVDSGSTPPVSPSFGAWTSTTGAERRSGVSPKGSSALVTQGLISVTSGANNRGLGLQIVIGPLPAQTLAGTITIVMDAIEGAANDNINQRSFSVRAADSSGAITGTHRALATSGSTTEIATSFGSSGVLIASAVSLTSTAIPAGGYIVVEVGLGLTATGTSPQFQFRYGETGTDHAASDGDATGPVGWIEFSQTLLLTQQGAATLSSGSSLTAATFASSAATLSSGSSLTATGTQSSGGPNPVWTNSDIWINTQVWDHSGTPTQEGAAALNSGSSLTATTTNVVTGAAALSSGSSLSSVTATSSAADLVSAGWLLTAIATLIREAPAAFTSASSLSATAFVVTVQEATATLSSGSSLIATSGFTQEAEATLSSGSRLYLSPDVTRTGPATPALVRTHNATGNKTSGTTNMSLSLTAAGVDAGNVLTAAISFDNTAAATPTVNSIGKPGGETANWVRLGQVNSSTATSAGGVRTELWAIETTVAWPANGSFVITLSAAVLAKGCLPREYSGTTVTLRGTAGAGTSTTGAPSAAATGPLAGDLVIGVAAHETSTLLTADVDVTGGVWLGAATYGTTGGTTTTNVQGITQYKVPSSSGTQTYNPLAGSGDSGALVVALVPKTVTVTTRHAEPIEFRTATSLTATGIVTNVEHGTALLSSGSFLIVGGEVTGPQEALPTSAEPGYAIPGSIWVGSGYSSPAQGGGATVEGAAFLSSASSLAISPVRTAQGVAVLNSASVLDVVAQIVEEAAALLASETYLEVEGDITTL